jgi:formate-dependent nitrite reductase membrane component NrfD
MTEIDVARHSLPIDPALHVWGWEIPVYLFLGGLAAGAMILGSLLSLRGGERSPASRWLALAAPALVSLGMVALFLDLAHKLHVWRFYLAFRWTSPMSWGAWILVLVYPVTLLFGLATLDDAQAERAAALAGRLQLGGAVRRGRALALRLPPRRLAWIHLGTGAALGIYTGVLLSTLGARALWSSALLGPLFLVSGLSTGSALMMLFPVSPEERRVLVRWDLLAIGLELAILLLLLAGLSTAGAGGKEAAGLLLGGPFTAQFWTLVVIGGLLAPVLLEALEARSRRVTAVAPLLVLAGGLALRWIFVAAGQV